MKNPIKIFRNYLETREHFDPDQNQSHTTLIIISLLIGLAGIIWSLMYYSLGYPITAVFPLCFTVITGLTFLVYLKTSNFGFFSNVQLILIFILPAGIQISIGGFYNAGAVIVWSFLAPLGSALFQGPKSSIKWIVLYLALLIAITLLDSQIYEFAQIEVSDIIRILFFSMNIGAVSVIVFLSIYFYVGMLNKAQDEISKKNADLGKLAQNLSRYLSPQVYDSIFAGKKEVSIESYRKKLTIFFSDIKDFTEITDTIEAEDLSHILNNYLNRMSSIALKYGGTIDKYIGDAIMIFFGDPETKGVKEDAIRCVQMAIEMQAEMQKLKEAWTDFGFVKPLQIRIGINTGYCTVGNFGSQDRLDYTIVGGEVNLASRLESKAKAGGILISEETFALIKSEIQCELEGSIQVKGINRSIRTYRVIGLVGAEKLHLQKSDESLSGFSLKIDLSKVTRDKARKLLTEALTKLEN